MLCVCLEKKHHTKILSYCYNSSIFDAHSAFTFCVKTKSDISLFYSVPSVPLFDICFTVKQFLAVKQIVFFF